MLEYLGVVLLFVILVGLAWDIARRRARAERKRLELEPYALLGENMEGVAHDTRALLRAARTTLEHLDRAPGEDQGALLRLADEQLQAAQSFLLALGSDPEQTTELEAVGCLRLVVALQRRFRRINTSGIAGEIHVEGRPGDLSRLFSNLLVNALEHTEGQVVVSTDGAAVHVENALQGPAPGPEIYRKGRSSKGQNRGLGLSLARQMADKLGAELEHQVLSREGQDWIRFVVTFKTDLPVADS